MSTASPDTSRDWSLPDLARLATALVAVGFALHWLRPLLVPLVLAALFSVTLLPVVRWLSERARVPRPLAILFAFLGLAAGVAGLVTLVVVAAQSLSSEAGAYESRIRALVGHVADTLQGWGLEVPERPVEAATDAMPLGAWARSVAQGTFAGLGSVFLVLVFAAYLLARPPHRGHEVGERVEARVREYLVKKTLIAAGVGVATGLVLWLVGAPMVLGFAVLAFLLDFIPNLGSMLAGALPLVVLALAPDVTLWQWGIAAGALFLVHFLSGNYITPKVMGEVLDLDPLVVLLALVFWGMLWGPVGVLLAVPVTAALKMAVQEAGWPTAL